MSDVPVSFMYANKTLTFAQISAVLRGQTRWTLPRIIVNEKDGPRPTRAFERAKGDGAQRGFDSRSWLRIVLVVEDDTDVEGVARRHRQPFQICF